MTMIHYFNSSLLADKISKKFEFQITSRKEQFALIFALLKFFKYFISKKVFIRLVSRLNGIRETNRDNQIVCYNLNYRILSN